MVLVVTVRLPVVGITAQLTAKLVVPTTPAISETIRGLSPLTVQFEASPERLTV